MSYDWKNLTPQLQATLDEACSHDRECGCALAICQRGETVVNIHSGYATLKRERKVTADSLFPLYSSGKAILIAAALQLIEEGKIALDTRIGELWSEFNAEGREKITVEHLLTHRGAMYRVPKYGSFAELADWELMCRRVAEMKPAAEPGTVCHYHPLTFAWLLGHTLELVTGKPLAQILTERILHPLHLEKEIIFGMDDEDEARFVVPEGDLELIQPSWAAGLMRDRAVQRGCIPSFNGVGTASGLAKFYDALNGGKILKRDTLEEAVSRIRRAPGNPPHEGEWTLFGLGFVLIGPAEWRGRIYGHSGAAGSEGFTDRETGISVGFVKNRLLPEHPVHPVRDKISALLHLPLRHW